MNAPATSPCLTCGEPWTFPAWKCNRCESRIIRPQAGPQVTFLSSDATIALFGGARAGGKALRLDEPVPTPTGWSTMGALRRGDLVLTENRHPTRVLAAHPVIPNPEAYLVELADGASVRACRDHQWGLVGGDVVSTVDMRDRLDGGHAVALPGGCGRDPRLVASIERCQSQPMRCITVANPSGLFLVGESFIVTHNTWSLLADWMRYITIPGATGLIVRAKLTSGMLGLWSKMEEFFDGTGAHSRAGQYNDFVWPCRRPSCSACSRKFWAKCTHSARLTMRYLGEKRKQYEEHKGPEYNWIAVEEANECAMPAIEFLLTCLRTSNPNLRPVLRMTCNPDDEHPLAEWVQWYLRDDGIPDREKAGRVLYTMRSTKTDQRIFGETRAQAGVLAQAAPGRAVSFTFVDANMSDNAAINSEEYGRTFSGMTGEEREKYEDGCWTPSRALGGMLSAEKWAPTAVTETLAPVKLTIRGWDFGASEPAKGRRPPDYTFAPLVKWDIHGRWYVADPFACRKEPDDLERLFEARVLADGPHVVQALEIEPGAGGKSFVHSMKSRIRLMFCVCSAKGSKACSCTQPRVILTSSKAGRQKGQSVKNTDPKIVKLRPVARELRLGMRGNVPADRDWKEDDLIPWSPRGFILIDPEDDWTQRPYRDKGESPPTLGALWRSQVHRFPHAEKDDAPDSLGIAHAAKRMLEVAPPTRRGSLHVVRT